MMGSYKVRTDLALESKERFEEDNVEVRGVEVEESHDEERDIRTTVVRITTENGARAMGKPKGCYITIEAPNMAYSDEDYHREISQEVAHHISQLLGDEPGESVLVVGLGNRDVTADCLGPGVISNLQITRHLIREFGKKYLSDKGGKAVSGIVPGVMAQTGMETFEIIQGIVGEIQPDVVIAVDSLAARSIKRLNRTIQITDTGINPGSGVGNHRQGLSEETLKVKVIGIGVPTVVDGATIVQDSMAHLLDALDERERKEFLEEMITPSLNQMYMTPKDVDETVKRLSYTISEGLNIAFSEV